MFTDHVTSARLKYIYIYILWDNDKYRSKPRLVEPLVVPVVSDIKRMLYTISRYIGRG